MSDELAPHPATPSCPNHPGQPASIPCGRCGSLVCQACVADSPPGEPVCPTCRPAHAFRALRREGVALDPAECLSQAWAVFRTRWTVLVVATLLVFGLVLIASLPSVVIQLLQMRVPPDSPRSLALFALWLPFELVAYYVNLSLQLGLLVVWLRLLRQQPAEPTHVFHGFRYGHRALLALFPLALAVIGGLLGLVVGAIVVATGLSLFLYLIVDKGMGPIASLKGSWELTRGRRWPMFVVLLLSIPLAIAGMLACCVGLIPAMALTVGMQSAAYATLAWPGNHYLSD